MSGLYAMFAANLIATIMFGIIGSWLLDITKYVITALVLTKIFHFLPNSWTTVIVVGIVALAGAALGFYLTFKDKSKNNNK